LIFLFSQTWLIQGLTPPCRILGSSMAPALLGAHYEVVCVDCGFPFFCDATGRPASSHVVCPNCGYAENNTESLAVLTGDRVLVDRSAFTFRRPRRWEVVAFRHPQEAGNILIKRVVGLPGESVQIQDGDVYINGQIQRKTLAQQRATAVMVYDAKYSPSFAPVPPQRWRGENEKSLWKSNSGQFTHPNTNHFSSLIPNPSQKLGNKLPSPQSSLVPNVDWLVYHHWRRMFGKPDDVEECPITDITAYNPNLPRREEDVHTSNDLMLSFRVVNYFGQGNIFIRANAGKDVFQIIFNLGAGTYRVIQNNRELFQSDNRFPLSIESEVVVVSLLDRQFLLAVNNKKVYCTPLDTAKGQAETASQSFALGVSDVGITIDDLRIFRDTYYTNPIVGNGGKPSGSAVLLGGDEYFVLGDNSVVSEDSRAWIKRSPVVDNLLIGKPLVILLPVKSAQIGHWQFQVPDISRIGYIR
jgi:signal peptidase I